LTYKTILPKSIDCFLSKQFAFFRFPRDPLVPSHNDPHCESMVVLIATGGIGCNVAMITPYNYICYSFKWVRQGAMYSCLILVAGAKGN
jgi:hypothetical protein